MTTEEKVDKIYTALLGNLDGSSLGALHTLNRITQDFYEPNEPKKAVRSRLDKLEVEKDVRSGFMAALVMVGGLVGFALTIIVEWWHKQ